MRAFRPTPTTAVYHGLYVQWICQPELPWRLPPPGSLTKTAPDGPGTALRTGHRSSENLRGYRIAIWIWSVLSFFFQTSGRRLKCTGNTGKSCRRSCSWRPSVFSWRAGAHRHPPSRKSPHRNPGLCLRPARSRSVVPYPEPMPPMLRRLSGRSTKDRPTFSAARGARRSSRRIPINTYPGQTGPGTGSEIEIPLRFPECEGTPGTAAGRCGVAGGKGGRGNGRRSELTGNAASICSIVLSTLKLPGFWRAEPEILQRFFFFNSSRARSRFASFSVTSL